MPRGQQEQADGDVRFIGVNSRESAGTLEPGFVSLARNVRFRNGVAESRLGVTKPAWLNNIAPESVQQIKPWGDVHGVGVFRDPDNLEVVIIAADGKTYWTRQNNNPRECVLPTGVTLVGNVKFVQAFNKLIMLRGLKFAPLVMTDAGDGFADMIPQYDSATAYSSGDRIAYGPWVGVSSMTRSGSTVTVDTSVSHGYTTGADVTISGASQSDYNARWAITVVDEDTFTFDIGTLTPVTPATGTITCSNMAYYWKASSGTSAGESPDSTPSKWTQQSTVTPNAVDGIYIQNRLVVASNYDQDTFTNTGKSDLLYATDILDPTTVFFDQQFRINQGDAGELVHLGKLSENQLVCFKDRSVSLLTGFVVQTSNVTLAANLSLQTLVPNYGIVASGASVNVGSDIYYWASRRGLVSLQATEQSKIQGVDLPLTDVVQDLVARVDPRNESKIRLSVWDNKVYCAVPLDSGDSGDNNGIIVYDLITKSWQGYDEGAAIKPKEFFLAQYNGGERLYFTSNDGFINLVEERVDGDEILDLSRDNEIGVDAVETYILTRGYHTVDLYARKLRAASVYISTWNPNFSINIIPDGAGESRSLVSDVTKDRAVYYTFDAANYNERNDDERHGDPYREDYSVMLPDTYDSLLTEEGSDVIVSESGNGVATEEAVGYLNFGSKGMAVGQYQSVRQTFSLPHVGVQWGQLEIINTEGRFKLHEAALTSQPGNRGARVEA